MRPKTKQQENKNSRAFTPRLRKRKLDIRPVSLYDLPGRPVAPGPYEQRTTE
jgi:hypothetical protein